VLVTISSSKVFRSVCDATYSYVRINPSLSASVYSTFVNLGKGTWTPACPTLVAESSNAMEGLRFIYWRRKMTEGITDRILCCD